MSIKFNVIEKHNPAKPDDRKKFYASTISKGEATIEDLTKSIEKISTVSGADIRGVLYALVDVLTTDLANGQIVRIGDLGSLRVSISSEGKEKAEQVNAASVIDSRILFTPGPKLKDMLLLLKYEKA
jgi:predicted histone-like DNA-binding protein